MAWGSPQGRPQKVRSLDPLSSERRVDLWVEGRAHAHQAAGFTGVYPHLDRETRQSIQPPPFFLGSLSTRLLKPRRHGRQLAIIWRTFGAAHTPIRDATVSPVFFPLVPLSFFVFRFFPPSLFLSSSSFCKVVKQREKPKLFCNDDSSRGHAPKRAEEYNYFRRYRNIESEVMAQVMQYQQVRNTMNLCINTAFVS